MAPTFVFVFVFAKDSHFCKFDSKKQLLVSPLLWKDEQETQDFELRKRFLLLLLLLVLFQSLVLLVCCSHFAISGDFWVCFKGSWESEISLSSIRLKFSTNLWWSLNFDNHGIAIPRLIKSLPFFSLFVLLVFLCQLYIWSLRRNFRFFVCVICAYIIWFSHPSFYLCQCLYSDSYAYICW